MSLAELIPRPAHTRAPAVAVRDAPPARGRSPEERSGRSDTSFVPIRPTYPVGGPLPTPREILRGSMPARYEPKPRRPVYFAVLRFEHAPAQFRRKECTNRQSAVPSEWVMH